MKRLIEFFLKNALVLNLFTLVVISLGIFVAITSNREAFPAVDFDTVSIRTIYPGASPKEVEMQVTHPLEDEIDGISGIDEYYSHSLENSSLIVIKLDPELPESRKNRTINDIQRAVDRVDQLPEGLLSQPSVHQLDSKEMPIIELALTGDFDYQRLHKISETLIERIKKLPDATAPLSYGFRKEEFWISVDPKSLEKNHLAISQVASALSRKNLNLPGGIIRSQKGDYLVRTIGEVKTSEEIDQIVIRTNSSGQSIRISDVAKTSRTFEDTDLLYRTNSKPSINLIIRKKTSGDIIDLVKDVKKLVKDYQNEIASDHLEVAYVNDLSIFVSNRLGVLVNNGVVGMVLVLISLLLFLSRGIALVAALGMPVALLGAIIVLNYLGLTINLLTLFALVIVLGMLVDDAIIVAENIWQHYESGKSPWDAAVAGASEVAWPVTATILTTIAAFSPLLMVYGIFGKFIESLPKVVIVSLVISLIEAIFILPSHAYEMLKIGEARKKRKQIPTKDLKEDQLSLLHRVIDWYGRFLSLALRWRYLLLVFMFAVLAAVFHLQKTRMKTILFPNDGVEFFFIRVDYPPETSRELTKENLLKFESLVKDHIPPEELKTFVTYVGVQQVDSIDPLRSEASNLGQIAVYLYPESQRERKADEIVDSLRTVTQTLAEQTGAKRTYFTMQRLGPPVGKPVAIRVFGKNFDSMLEAAKRVKTELTKINGVFDVTEDYILGKREIQIRIDQQKAARALLSTHDVASHMRASLAGQVASYIHEDAKKIPVRIRYQQDNRENIEDVKKTVLMNSLGHQIPIAQIAKFSEGQGISSIKHVNGTRVITVTANLNESITTSNEVNQAMLATLDSLKEQYPDLDLERGGEYEDTSKSIESLGRAFLIAIAIIFVILAAQFKSLSQPIVVMAAIPFGIIGVILAFYTHGLPFSFIALIGVIGLSGVVVNDSIVLVDFINKARQRGSEAIPAIIYAGKRRFRAVWLTSITTIFGLLPLAYGIGGEDAFLKPAAMALGFGLVFATVLILVLIPALYMIRVDILNILIGLARPAVKALFHHDMKKIH